MVNRTHDSWVVMVKTQKHLTPHVIRPIYITLIAPTLAFSVTLQRYFPNPFSRYVNPFLLFFWSLAVEDLYYNLLQNTRPLSELAFRSSFCWRRRKRKKDGSWKDRDQEDWEPNQQASHLLQATKWYFQESSGTHCSLWC